MKKELLYRRKEHLGKCCIGHINWGHARHGETEMAKKNGDSGLSNHKPPKDEWRLEDWKKEGWNAFFHEISRRLYGYFLENLENEEDAEDALQETFYRFFKSIDRYDGSRPLLPWIMRIAHNVKNNVLRERYKYSPIDLTEDIVDDSLTADLGADLEVELAIEQLTKTLRLNKIQAAIFILRALEVLKIGDIAHILNESPKKISQHYWRAKKKIKNRYNEDL